jgi:hypothetical protein
MARGTCKEDGCGKSVHARGWCNMHYERWRLRGTVDGPLGQSLGSPDERFRTFFRKRGPDDCWMWLGDTNPKGYGQFYLNGTSVRAHRYAYELATGEVLGSRQIDHMCHKRWCVNPRHLRAVNSKQQNENKRYRNRTGFRGVCKSRNKFRAKFTHNYKQVHVGTFDTATEANEANIAARNQYFTHNDDDRLE